MGIFFPLRVRRSLVGTRHGTYSKHVNKHENHENKKIIFFSHKTLDMIRCFRYHVCMYKTSNVNECFLPVMSRFEQIKTPFTCEKTRFACEKTDFGWKISRCNRKISRCTVKILRCTAKIFRCMAKILRCTAKILRCTVKILRCNPIIERYVSMIKHSAIIFREWKHKIKHSQAKKPLVLKIDAWYGDKRSDALKK